MYQKDENTALLTLSSCQAFSTTNMLFSTFSVRIWYLSTIDVFIGRAIHWKHSSPVATDGTIRNEQKGLVMNTCASTPDFDELASAIKTYFDTLRDPYRQWTDLARCAIQGRRYDESNFASVATYINKQRAELRKLVFVATEHFSDEQVEMLQRRAKISKYAWKSLKKSSLITLKNGFTLLIY